MIVGVGVDIVSVGRIEDLIEKFGSRFLDKCFTEAERDWCERINDLHLKAEEYATRFAAKEAVSKAFGTGIIGISFKEIEVKNEEGGKPIIQLHGKAKKIAHELKISNIQISLTHEGSKALAYVIAEAI